MEDEDFKNVVKGSTEALSGPFVIIIKNNKTEPDLEVTIKTADPCDAISLATRIVERYKAIYLCDPIVELQPFMLEGDDQDEVKAFLDQREKATDEKVKEEMKK